MNDLKCWRTSFFCPLSHFFSRAFSPQSSYKIMNFAPPVNDVLYNLSLHTFACRLWLRCQCPFSKKIQKSVRCPGGGPMAHRPKLLIILKSAHHTIDKQIDAFYLRVTTPRVDSMNGCVGGFGPAAPAPFVVAYLSGSVWSNRRRMCFPKPFCCFLQNL